MTHHTQVGIEGIHFISDLIVQQCFKILCVRVDPVDGFCWRKMNMIIAEVLRIFFNLIKPPFDIEIWRNDKISAF